MVNVVFQRITIGAILVLTAGINLYSQAIEYNQYNQWDAFLIERYCYLHGIDSIDRPFALEILRQLDPSFSKYSSNEFLINDQILMLKNDMDPYINYLNLKRKGLEPGDSSAHHYFDFKGSMGNFDFNKGSFLLSPFAQSINDGGTNQGTLPLSLGSKALMNFKTAKVSGSSFLVRFVNGSDFSELKVPTNSGRDILALTGEDRSLFYRIYFSFIERKESLEMAAFAHRLEIFADRNHAQLLAVLQLDENSVPSDLRPVTSNLAKRENLRFEDQAWLYRRWHRYDKSENSSYHQVTDTLWIEPSGKLKYVDFLWYQDRTGNLVLNWVDKWDCSDFIFEKGYGVRAVNGQTVMDTVYKIVGTNCRKTRFPTDPYNKNVDGVKFDGFYFSSNRQLFLPSPRETDGYYTNFAPITQSKLASPWFKTVTQRISSGFHEDLVKTRDAVVKGNTEIANDPKPKVIEIPKSPLPTNLKLDTYQVLLSVANQYNKSAKDLLGVKVGFENCASCSPNYNEVITDVLVKRLGDFYRTRLINSSNLSLAEFGEFSELEVGVTKIAFTPADVKTMCQLEMHCIVRKESAIIIEGTIRSQISLLEDAYPTNHEAVKGEITLLAKAVENFVIDCYPIYIKVKEVIETSKSAKVKKIAAGDAGDFPQNTGGMLNTLASGVNESLVFAIVNADEIGPTTSRSNALMHAVGECRFDKVENGQPVFVVTKGENLAELISSGKGMLLSK